MADIIIDGNLKATPSGAAGRAIALPTGAVSKVKVPYIEWAGTTGRTTFNLLPVFQNVDGDALEITFKCGSDQLFSGTLLGESSNSGAMRVYFYSGTNMLVNTIYYTSSFSIYDKHTLKIQYNPMCVIMDDVSRDISTFSEKSVGIAIGCVGRNGGGNGFTGKIYSFKKWNAGELTYDCVPAINPSNNEATFLNLATGVYLSKHQSTKPLIYGEE